METVLKKWTRFVVRWPLIIIALWFALVAVAWVFSPSIDSVAASQNNTSSLPASAPSNRAESIYAAKFSDPTAGLNKENDLIILTNPQGISARDVSQVEQIENWLTTTRPAHFATVLGPGAQLPATAFESKDHQALRLILTWDTSNNALLSNSMKQIYAYLAQQHPAPGGFLGITGSTPIQYDLEASIFNTNAGDLVGLIIVLVVLSLVYRSPLAVMVPLIAVGMALGLAIPLIAWAGKLFGITVASFSLEYVGFVLLGAGTNYGVFMISRYREELRRSTDSGKASRHAALERTVGHVGESITSSALTVIVAMALMGLAQLYILRVTGPAIAIGVVCVLLVGLSLLPALMAICGKAFFWPVQPRPGTLNEETIPRGLWARAGSLVTARPIQVTLLTAVVLLPLAASALLINPSFDDLKSVPASSLSVQAFNAYNNHFQDAAQVRVIINAPGRDLRQATYSDVFQQLGAAFAHVAHVTDVQAPTNSQSAQQSFAQDGSAAVLTVSINVDPYSVEARQTVGALYTAAAQAQHNTPLSGAQVLISGQSSQVYDQAIQSGNDFTLIVILVCIAILLILTLLVRSITAPIYLLGTIALSALTAVGLTNLVYNVILGKPVFEIVPIFAFVFLVSLGEDFNILTISRIREEVQVFGHKRGIAMAIALTGGTVSSCGLVMAASFSQLATNAIVEVSEIGFTVVAGILLDTFVVRPLLVPAIATLLGRWNWVWPGSQLFKRGSTSTIAPAVTVADTEKEKTGGAVSTLVS